MRKQENKGNKVPEKKWRMSGKKWAASLCLVSLIGAGVFLLVPKPEGGATPAGPAAPAAGGAEVSYPVNTFQDGKARHYEYKAGNGITVKYFILKSSDGVIRAAFDACDVCWPQAKGYTQSGDFMVCRNCGRRFASVNVNVITGGCNPGALTRTVVGDKLVIKVGDIVEGGRKYFDFAKRG